MFTCIRTLAGAQYVGLDRYKPTHHSIFVLKGSYTVSQVRRYLPATQFQIPNDLKNLMLSAKPLLQRVCPLHSWSISQPTVCGQWATEHSSPVLDAFSTARLQRDRCVLVLTICGLHYQRYLSIPTNTTTVRLQPSPARLELRPWDFLRQIFVQRYSIPIALSLRPKSSS